MQSKYIQRAKVRSGHRHTKYIRVQEEVKRSCIGFVFYKNIMYTLLDAMQKESTKKDEMKPLLKAKNKRKSIFVGKIEIRTVPEIVIITSKTQKKNMLILFMEAFSSGRDFTKRWIYSVKIFIHYSRRCSIKYFSSKWYF